MSWPAVLVDADCNYFSQWKPSHVKPPLHSCVPIRSLQSTVRGTPFTTSVTLVNRFHSHCEHKGTRVCTSLQIILPEKLLGRESSFIQSNWNQNILWCESLFSRLPLFFCEHKTVTFAISLSYLCRSQAYAERRSTLGWFGMRRAVTLTWCQWTWRNITLPRIKMAFSQRGRR